MHCRILEEQPDKSLVELEGPFDYRTVPEVRKQLLSIARRKGKGKMVMDFSKVSSIDTSGIAILVELSRSLSRRGAELRLTGLSAHASRMISLARLDQVFNIGNQPHHGM